VLCDLAASHVERTTRPLPKRNHKHDGKRDTLQVNCGLVTDTRDCRVAVSVLDGDVSSSSPLAGAVGRLREDSGIRSVIMVGGRGMIAQMTIDELAELENAG
jgi:transposase